MSPSPSSRLRRRNVPLCPARSWSVHVPRSHAARRGARVCVRHMGGAQVLLLCERCAELITRDCKGADARELRFLEEAMWAETPVVADTAKGLLRKVDADWARDALEMAGE